MSVDVATQLAWLGEAMDEVVADLDVDEVVQRVARRRWEPGDPKSPMPDPSPSRSQRPMWLAAAASLLVVALGASLWWLRPSDEPASGTAGDATAGTSDGPDDVLPDGAVLRSVVNAPVGEFRVFDAVEADQVCQFLLHDGGTVGGCIDTPQVVDGLAYTLTVDNVGDPWVLFGLFPPDGGYHATIEGRLVRPDEHGIWYAVLDHAPTEFTVTTASGSKVIALEGPPGEVSARAAIDAVTADTIDLPPMDGRAAQSPQWQAQGEWLIREITESQVRAPSGYVDPTRPVFAYQSDPIDIDGPGVYTLVFDVDDDYFAQTGDGPLAVAYNVPWDFAHDYLLGSVEVDKESHTVRVELTIPDDESVHYEQFSVWMY